MNPDELDPNGQIPAVDEELEAELAAFAEEESKKLGLHRQQYTETINKVFTGEQRAYTTMWISGLSLAHDELASRALRGIGYNVEVMDVPDNDALTFGKEFGNRGQCSPTYFTVGNLIKHLVTMRDVHGIPTKEIIEKHLFLTAGACGPCRFGTYVTEYRKALRDSGFEGFRVMLFQQQGGIKQATGDELGLKLNAAFAVALVTGLLAGDTLNLVGYRMRPYEVVPGSVNKTMTECKKLVGDALEANGSVVLALLKCRRLLRKIELDRSQPKPVVSVSGEFWAMTTEGDGNYHMQSFLEQEGAEVDIQPLINWLLFMVWENKYDTIDRMRLRDADGSRRGLQGKDATKKLWILKAADGAMRGVFYTYATVLGLHGYHLPDMDEIARLAAAHYDNNIRGGEGHMEVGKLLHFIEDEVNHMTLSVKPFGCMPSSGVSDGVQSIVQSEHPTSLFIPIETTGDGEVNAHSRVQMMLFKARNKARDEFDRALEETGQTPEGFRARLKSSWRGRISKFWRPKHKRAGQAANLVYALG